MKNPTPNLTIIFVSVAIVAAVGIAGGVFLTIADKDATAFYGFFTVTLTSVVGFGTLARSQGKANEQIERVETKVNGNLTRLIEIAMNGGAQTRAEAKEAQQIGVNTGVIDTPDQSRD